MEEGEHVAQLNGPSQDAFLRQEAGSFIDYDFQVLAMDEFQDQVRTIVLTKIIINPGNGRVVEGCEDIGFTLEVLNDGFSDQWVGSAVNHLFHRYQFDHAWEMQVTGAINRTHASHANNILDHIAVNEGYSRSQL